MQHSESIIWDLNDCLELAEGAVRSCLPRTPRVVLRSGLLTRMRPRRGLGLLLGQGEEEAKVSFKSLKATLISWAAKRGVEPLTLAEVRLSDYHASGGMDIVYSRDSQAPLVMLVEKLLRDHPGNLQA